jgi:hypothetical protein
MSNHGGSGLIVAGAILTVVGACIVLVRVYDVPTYWVPLIAGIGLLFAGIIRQLLTRR